MNTNHATTSRTAAILEAPRVFVRIAAFVAVVVGLTLVGSSAAFAETPENDLLADSVVIDPTALPFTSSVDTSEATSDDDDSDIDCSAPKTDASVWYSITPTSDLLLVVGAEESDYSWGISLATGEPGALETIECRPFSFLVEAKANVTYYFQVFDDQEDGGGNGGALEFTLEESTSAALAEAGGAPDAPFVIETQLVFHEEGPPSGTFAVVAGSNDLGCASGTFVDPTHEDIDDELVQITKVFTCESGPRTGTFSVQFIPGQDVNEIDRQAGPWEVTEGTGDYVGLTGGGDHTVVFDSPSTGAETLAGSIELAAAQGELALTGSDTATLAGLGAAAILVGLGLVTSRRRLVRR